MAARVHLAGWLLLAGLWPALALAQYPPPGLQAWGRQTDTLQPGEALTVAVDFAQIPVRRWVLLVESDGQPAHLNVRRAADGSLLYDQRDETRHLVDVPWGEGEELSAVLTAPRGGVFTVSIWGPSPDGYRRSYRYDVNRALEALADGDRSRALGCRPPCARTPPTWWPRRCCGR